MLSEFTMMKCITGKLNMVMFVTFKILLDYKKQLRCLLILECSDDKVMHICLTIIENNVNVTEFSEGYLKQSSSSIII